MGGFLAFIVVAAIIGWTIYVQIGARQQVDVTTKLSEPDAGQVVRDYFGVMWTLVNGPGHVNYRPKLRAHAPVVSISFSSDGTSDCDVSIWTSSWQTRYGVIAHAQLAWRKKAALANHLRNAQAVDSNRAPGT